MAKEVLCRIDMDIHWHWRWGSSIIEVAACFKSVSETPALETVSRLITGLLVVICRTFNVERAIGAILEGRDTLVELPFDL